MRQGNTRRTRARTLAGRKCDGSHVERTARLPVPTRRPTLAVRTVSYGVTS